MKHPILITGFGPFGRLTTNPSEQFARWLHQEQPSTRLVILPTSYRRAAGELEAELRKIQPSSVLLFGYSAKARGLRVERRARNADASMVPDIDGMIGSSPIIAGAPNRLATNVDVDALVVSLRTAGALANTSDDAGGYVCNHVYFGALQRLRLTKSPCLLIHISETIGLEKQRELYRGGTLVLDWLHRVTTMMPSGPGT